MPGKDSEEPPSSECQGGLPEGGGKWLVEKGRGEPEERESWAEGHTYTVSKRKYGSIYKILLCGWSQGWAFGHADNVRMKIFCLTGIMDPLRGFYSEVPANRVHRHSMKSPLWSLCGQVVLLSFLSAWHKSGQVEKKKKLPSNWPVGKSMGQLLDWPKPMPHPQPVPPLVSACSFPVWLPWFLSSIPSCSHAFPWFGMLLSYLTVTREKGASGASRESHLLGVEARGDMFRPYGE